MPPPNINGSYTRGRAWKPLPGIYLESEVLASAAFAELNLNGIRVLLRRLAVLMLWEGRVVGQRFVVPSDHDHTSRVVVVEKYN